MKTRVVWRYYLFWLLKGLEPSFYGLSYYFIKQECEITQVEYGVINVIGSSTLLSGVLIYQVFLRNYEMRTLQYVVAFITIFSLLIDLWQALRYNLQYGISDFWLFCFGGAFFSPLTFAMT
jgi:hypothetical protein